MAGEYNISYTEVQDGQLSVVLSSLSVAIEAISSAKTLHQVNVVETPDKKYKGFVIYDT